MYVQPMRKPCMKRRPTGVFQPSSSSTMGAGGATIGVAAIDGAGSAYATSGCAGGAGGAATGGAGGGVRVHGCVQGAPWAKLVEVAATRRAAARRVFMAVSFLETHHAGPRREHAAGPT